jgi:hypothetical protein
MIPNILLEQKASNVFKIEQQVKLGFEQKYLLVSDVHFDNPDCDRKLFKEHLEEAKRIGAGIIINGDFFCMMEGRADPRNSKKLYPKHLGMNYLDNVIEDAAEFLEPYVENIIFIGMGNHETAILKRNETNVTERLCGLLTYRTKHKVYNGFYGGFVRFMFYCLTKNGHKGMRHSYVMSYFHGSGGAGVMTKGVNKHMQRLTFMPDANIHWMGHTHQEMVIPHARVRLSDQGKIYHDECLLLNTSTYKDEYKGGKLGWAVQSGHPPKNKGALWLIFDYKKSIMKDNKPVKYYVSRAR